MRGGAEPSADRGRAAVAAVALLAISAAAVALPWPLRGCLERLPASTAIYDRRGELVRLAIAADGRYRLASPLSAYPRDFVEAVLLKEDRAFFLHPGANPRALARALAHRVAGSAYRPGGSTITMQLARLVGGFDSSTAAGKLRQVRDALLLECIYPKRRILEAYLELAPCGGNIEGFAAASLAYFGLPLERLPLAERLLLACLPQRPRATADGASLARLLESRALLYRAWVARHPGQALPASALDMPVSLAPRLPFRAPHAADSLLRRSPGRARIDATLDLGLQDCLERVLSGYVGRKRPEGIRNACALLVDADGMRVLAEVGSAGFLDDSIDGQVDGAEARRSPGSALKPFLYALALDQGLIHPLTTLRDSPIRYAGYDPDNFDDEFEGPLAAKDALVRSRNVPAVYLAQRVDGPDLYGLLASAGVGGLRGRAEYGLSIVLGTAEVTMKELAALYGALANGGRFSPLLDASWPGPAAPARSIASPEAAWLVLDMLREKPRPDESKAVLSRAGQPACAWKTGTSIGFRDAWSIGVFGHYVIAAWVGNFDGAPNPAFTGLGAAAPLMFAMIDALAASGLDCSPGDWASRPAALARVEVCAASGMIPTSLCSRRSLTWFIPGRSPIAPCDVHREVFVDLRSGLRRRAFEPGATRREVMEIWSSDIMALFAKAGLPRRAPPPFAPGEGLGAGEAEGAGPAIVSPLRGGTYLLGPEMAFQADAPSDCQRLFWFLDESYLGSTPRGEPLFWKPRPGSFVLRATDDLGRSASCPFAVSPGG